MQTPEVQLRDHRLALDPPAGDHVGGMHLVTALPRGRRRGHRLVCGNCLAVLARDHCPLPPTAPLMRCHRCKAVNDLTRSVEDMALPA